MLNRIFIYKFHFSVSATLINIDAKLSARFYNLMIMNNIIIGSLI